MYPIPINYHCSSDASVGVCKLTDTILQIDRDVIKIFEECIYGAEEEIGKSKECNS